MKYTILCLFFISITGYSQFYQEWTASYNSNFGFNYNDWPNACFVDNIGNTYITGSMYDQQNSPRNFVTVKLDPNGNVVWSTKYDNGWTIAYSLTVDKLGNVYVCGSSSYMIIKYNSSGLQQWIMRETEIGGVSCRSIIADTLGYIYVVGEGTDIVPDIVTAKYNTNGVRQWLRRYKNSSNNSNYSRQIKSDRFGNIYVICYSYLVSSSDAVATTIKYNNNGILQWISTYDATTGLEQPRAIDIDENGNAYIIGYTQSNYALNDYDYFTIKYGPGGDSLWVEKYNGLGGSGYGQSWDVPNDIKLNNSGDAFVTGYSAGNSGNYDFLTIKYNENGDTSWVSRLNIGNANDYANSLLLDMHGNICVAGSSDSNYLTVKYDQNGNILWSRSYSGLREDIAKFIRKDNSGNIIVSGYSFMDHTNDDYYTIKYSANGDELWSNRFSSDFASNDVLYDMTIKNNNLYVTGKAETDTNGYDIMTIKYNSQGQTVWMSRFNDVNSGNDEPYSIIADSNENIYVTGSSIQQNNLKDVVTIKYNSLGQQLWINKFNGNANSDDVGKKIMLDQEGNIYICGFTQSLSTGRDGLLLKYSYNGNLIWNKRFNFNGNDEFITMFLDSYGNAYAAGYTELNGGTDYYFVKIDNNGETAWSKIYDKLKYDTAKSVINNNGNLLLSGRSFQNSFLPPYNFVTEASVAFINYDPNGNIIWLWDTSDTGVNTNVEYVVNSLVLDSAFNIYMTGRHNNSILTAKINSDGFKVWFSEFNLSSGRSESMSILMNSFQQPIVGGFSKNISNDEDIVVIRYNNVNGALLSQNVYSSQGGGSDILSTAKFDLNNNLYAGGYTYFNSQGSDYKVIKYSNTLGISPISQNIPKLFSLFQNYPNPFNPQTKIKFDVPSNVRGQTSNVKLIIYDLLGREVATLVNEELKPGTYEADWDGSNFSSGVYFYKLVAGDFVETKKMVLMK